MLKWLKQGPKEAKVYPLLLLRHVLQLQQLHCLETEGWPPMCYHCPRAVSKLGRLAQGLLPQALALKREPSAAFMTRDLHLHLYTAMSACTVSHGQRHVLGCLSFLLSLSSSCFSGETIIFNFRNLWILSGS